MTLTFPLSVKILGLWTHQSSGDTTWFAPYHACLHYPLVAPLGCLRMFVSAPRNSDII